MGGYEGWAKKDSRHAKVQRAGLWGGGKGGNLQQVDFETFYCCYCMYRDLSKQTLEEQKQIQKSCCGYLGERKAGSHPSRKRREKEQKHKLLGAWQKEPLQSSNNPDLNPPPHQFLKYLKPSST